MNQLETFPTQWPGVPRSSVKKQQTKKQPLSNFLVNISQRRMLRFSSGQRLQGAARVLDREHFCSPVLRLALSAFMGFDCNFTAAHVYTWY